MNTISVSRWHAVVSRGEAAYGAVPTGLLECSSRNGVAKAVIRVSASNVGQ